MEPILEINNLCKSYGDFSILSSNLQKSDIIGALSMFPYMALMYFLYKYLIVLNVVCYTVSQKLYECKPV